ncbi:MAG: nicotinate-nucleotide--dimethylbenzimidazole phosphoribosyltransferase [Pseudomonadota bacterium]
MRAAKEAEIVEQKLYEIIDKIQPLDRQAMEAAAKRQDELTKPKGALGVLESLSIQIAGIQGRVRPDLSDKVVFCLAGDHGVTASGVSAYPAEVTPQMVLNFLTGGAGINVMARQIGARVVVADLGVNYDFSPPLAPLALKIRKGTADMTRGPAMTREEAVKCVLNGIELVERESSLDILGTGDMGIGNTTPSSAITAVMTGSRPAEVTGRGTGLDDRGLTGKVAAIEKALAVNRPDPNDALDVLAKVGGFEIGGIAGLIIGGARRRVPVIIDGFISGAGALIACALAPRVKDYLIAAHQSVEIGHQRLLEHLGLRPLVNLDLRLGEGTGAVIGLFLAQCAAAVLNEMATFAEAGVSDKEG